MVFIGIDGYLEYVMIQHITVIIHNISRKITYVHISSAQYS